MVAWVPIFLFSLWLYRTKEVPRKFCRVIFDQKNMYFEGELVILIIQIRNFDEKLALSGQKDEIDGQNAAFFDQKWPQQISGAKVRKTSLV